MNAETKITLDVAATDLDHALKMYTDAILEHVNALTDGVRRGDLLDAAKAYSGLGTVTYALLETIGDRVGSVLNMYKILDRAEFEAQTNASSFREFMREQNIAAVKRKLEQMDDGELTAHAIMHANTCKRKDCYEGPAIAEETTRRGQLAHQENKL